MAGLLFCHIHYCQMEGKNGSAVGVKRLPRLPCRPIARRSRRKRAEREGKGRGEGGEAGGGVRKSGAAAAAAKAACEDHVVCFNALRAKNKTMKVLRLVLLMTFLIYRMKAEPERTDPSFQVQFDGGKLYWASTVLSAAVAVSAPNLLSLPSSGYGAKKQRTPTISSSSEQCQPRCFPFATNFRTCLSFPEFKPEIYIFRPKMPKTTYL